MYVHRTIRHGFVSFIFVLVLPAAALAATFRVDPTATGNGSGDSWPNACTSIEAAFALVQNPEQDVIWVAAATYIPTYQTDPEDPRSATFLISGDPNLDGIKIYGGFLGLAHPNGGETMLSQRDPENNVTILSGEIDDPGLEDNCYHVVIFNEVGSETYLDGFKITGGSANTGASLHFGGGMWIEEASPTIVRCTFSGNYAGSGAGAAVPSGGSPRFVNCSFIDNEALSAGGGLFIELADEVVVVNSVFSGNTTSSQGGGIWVFQADLLLINCSIAGNHSHNGGENGQSGGVHVRSAAFFPPTLLNCILWGNTADIGSVEAQQMTGQGLAAPPPLAVVKNTCIEGLDVYEGNENIGDDPEFVDAENHNLRLSSGSPCINAGDNDDLPVDFGDLNANSDFTERLPRDLDVHRKRVLHETVEMGAFEFGCNADLNGDCEIGETDLRELLGAWDEDGYGAPPYRQSDLNEDGKVDGLDIGLLLDAYGDCESCGEESFFGGSGGEMLAQFLQWLEEEDWEAFLAWWAEQ